jgi:class 3 adenylate cyclase
MMAHASHTIASGLLAAYLGADAGRRVHAGAIERGSVESIRAVLWYADIRAFTAIADTTPGAVVVEMLDEVFETLTASLRSRGGQVLKFLGDGMLAIFPSEDGRPDQTCRRALDAAAEAMRAVDRLNAARHEAGKPAAAVDLALHLGEVLYGNVGAIDRLDFTVIGPAVNEVGGSKLCASPSAAGFWFPRISLKQLATAVVWNPSGVTRCAAYATRAKSTAWTSKRGPTGSSRRANGLGSWTEATEDVSMSP